MGYGQVRCAGVRSGSVRCGWVKSGTVRNRVEAFEMPRKRLPKELWDEKRTVIWNRDGRMCVRCRKPQRLNECHIDHIKSGKRGTNECVNLRTLCRRCHVLRADFRHRGMIAKALADGIIPFNWREFVWDDLPVR